ncbi:MAG: hypothetical protein ACREHG_04635, partial [Candidatus Saccharimonadales bacterium]
VYMHWTSTGLQFITQFMHPKFLSNSGYLINLIYSVISGYINNIYSIYNKTMLEKVDDELVCMAMIHSLPSEYAHLASSLLLLEKLDKATIQAAFVNEEINCHCQAKVKPNNTVKEEQAIPARTLEYKK